MQKKTNVTLSIKGTLIVSLVCLFLIAATFAISYLPLRFSAAVTQGMKILNNDPAVAEVFGSPVRLSLLARGKLNEYMGGSGNGYIWSSISGPKTHGKAYFYVCKPVGGDWQLKGISINVNEVMVLLWYAYKSNSGFQYVPNTSSPSGPSLQLPTELPTP